jgi:RimJ/RimL family protein N-acetyltransferase
VPSVQLLALTPALRTALNDPGELARSHDLRLGAVAELARAIADQSEAYRATTDAPPEWSGHLAVDVATRQVVGSCGYKGAPRADGGVEIAYFTFPEFERRGYGGAMAEALVQQAIGSGIVRVVHAHTLPEPNASTRILTRLGFTCTGTVIDDPADGPVWHWARAVRDDPATPTASS